MEIGVYIGTNNIEYVVASRAFMNTKTRVEIQQYSRQNTTQCLNGDRTRVENQQHHGVLIQLWFFVSGFCLPCLLSILFFLTLAIYIYDQIQIATLN